MTEYLTLHTATDRQLLDGKAGQNSRIGCSGLGVSLGGISQNIPICIAIPSRRRRQPRQISNLALELQRELNEFCAYGLVTLLV